MLDSSPREPVRGLPSLSRTSEPHVSVPFPLGTQAGDKRPREIIRWSTLIHTHARFGGRGCICLFSNAKYPLLCQFSGKKTGIWLILYYRLNFRIPDFQKNEHGKLSRTHRSFLQFFEKKKNEAGTYLPIFYAGQHNSATTRGSERKNNNSLHLNMFAENWF